MHPRDRRTHIAIGILLGETSMAKLKASQTFVPILSASSHGCTIEFDQHLEALLSGTLIEELDDQMTVCEALCNIGLADHRMFVDDTSGSQKHCYTSTKAMREVAKEYLTRRSIGRYRAPADSSEYR